MSREHIFQFSNVLRSFLGSNFLAMPYVFARGGLMGGIIVIILVAYLTNYGCKLLLGCKRNNTTMMSPLDTYGKVGGAIIGTNIVVFIDLLIIFTQIGFCVSYAIFIATNIMSLCNISSEISFVLVGIGVIPFVLIKNVKNLAWTSSISSVLLLIGMIGCVSFFDINFEIIPAEPWINWSSMFVILGLVTASFEGIGLVIPVEESISLSFVPNPYDKMLNFALGIATTILVSFGLGGFLTFGNATDAVFSVNLPENTAISFFLKISFTSAIFLTYPLQMFPVVETIEKHFASTKFLWYKRYTVAIGYFLRIFLVYLTVCIGYFVPSYGLVGAIVGSFGSSTLTYILPALLVYKSVAETSAWQKLKLFALITFGSILAVAGTISAITEILQVLFK